jgi:hypothetical protein
MEFVLHLEAVARNLKARFMPGVSDISKEFGDGWLLARKTSIPSRSSLSTIILLKLDIARLRLSK